MGKRKWKRIKFTDLADPEKSRELMDLISRAGRQPEAESPEKRPHENPQVEQ